MSRRRCVIFLFLSVLLAVSAQASDEDLLRLREKGLLRATLEIESQAPYLQRASLLLAVEIATRLSFARGTQVQDFRIPGALVRPVSSFALNGSERIDGYQWVSQRWRFRVYPLSAGPLALPPISVALDLNQDSGPRIRGEVTVSHPPLAITVPDGAQNLEDWVAAPRLELRESWEGQRDHYEPGDALTRVRTFEADDVPGMLFTPSSTPELPGLSSYAAPAEVQDHTNRGRLLGTRRETLVVTVEEPGTYELPGRTFSWYNTRRQRVETVELPPYRFTVDGAGPAREDSVSGEQTGPSNALRLAGLIAILLLATLMLRWGPKVFWRLRAALRPAHQFRAYRRALRAGDARQALDLLDEHQRDAAGHRSLTEACDGDPAARTALRALLEAAYGHPRPRTPGDGLREESGDDVDYSAFKQLWHTVGPARLRTPQRETGTLRLNPREARATGSAS